MAGAEVEDDDLLVSLDYPSAQQLEDGVGLGTHVAGSHLPGSGRSREILQKPTTVAVTIMPYGVLGSE